MRCHLTALAAGLLAAASIAAADAPTPAQHPERDYRAIGGGVFLRRDDDLQPDEDGNITTYAYSQQSINLGSPYTLDVSAMAGIPQSLRIDGGTLGPLRMVQVQMDCAHRTYVAYNSHRALPEAIWRPAATAPALAPLFQYVCSRASKH